MTFYQAIKNQIPCVLFSIAWTIPTFIAAPMYPKHPYIASSIFALGGLIAILHGEWHIKARLRNRP